jgi:hypothetical protein
MTLQLKPSISYDDFVVGNKKYDNPFQAMYDIFKNFGFEGVFNDTIPVKLIPVIVDENKYKIGASLMMFYKIIAKIDGKDVDGIFQMPIKVKKFIGYFKDKFTFKQDDITKYSLYNDFITQYAEIKKKLDFIEKIYNEGNTKKWKQPDTIPTDITEFMEKINKSMAMFDEQGRRLKSIEKTISEKSDVYDAIENGLNVLQLETLPSTDEYPIRFIARILGIESGNELNSTDVAEIRMSMDDLKKRGYKISKSDISKLIQKMYKTYSRKPQNKILKGKILSYADKLKVVRNIKI